MIEPVEASPIVLPVADMPTPTKLATVKSPVLELLQEIFFTVLFCKYSKFEFAGPGFEEFVILKAVKELMSYNSSLVSEVNGNINAIKF